MYIKKETVHLDLSLSSVTQSGAVVSPITEFSPHMNSQDYKVNIMGVHSIVCWQMPDKIKGCAISENIHCSNPLLNNHSSKSKH